MRSLWAGAGGLIHVQGIGAEQQQVGGSWAGRLSQLPPPSVFQEASVAEEHLMPLQALQLLVAWPALTSAARYEIEPWQEWDGEAFKINGPSAEHLRTSE